MRYLVDHDYHIHSELSLCSNDPEETPAHILEIAKEKGIKKLCLTDHYWDENVPGASDFYKKQDYAHIAAALPLPQDPEVEFHFGCETDLDKHMTLGITKPLMDKMEFIIIPTTHLHMKDFTIRRDATLEERAAAWVSRFRGVLDMDLPFHKIGIAHLACSLIAPNGEYYKVLEMLKDEELSELFEKSAERGVGIELNSDDFYFGNKPEETKEATFRVFRAAKKAGCLFYIGSDAHHPAAFKNCYHRLQEVADQLGLTEDDKFRPFG
ncbi:MAG: PHP domain-containing protein [Clostridia bacterium]|nr:PHP domain-containing protein [Clostridia bacterium]MDD7700563.1 PHP domain-containing protein [Eubacteriales bacterium]MDY2827571.1 PHP domain-containing protein [Eubacteriales bacterium]